MNNVVPQVKSQLISDMVLQPSLIADLVRDSRITPEEAICTVAEIIYGSDLSGKFKTIQFEQFWSAQLSNVPYKQTLLDNVNPSIEDVVRGQIKREKDRIYNDTIAITQRIRHKVPELWALIKDSDIYWMLPTNVENIPLEDAPVSKELDSDFFREKPHPTRTPLNGELNWSTADDTWVRRTGLEFS